MKLSAWIGDLVSDLQTYGDHELSDMPDGWLSDVIPDDVARWLLMHRWVEVTLHPDGHIVPGVLGSDPEDDEIAEVSQRLEDAVLAYADAGPEREQLIASLRRALHALGIS